MEQRVSASAIVFKTLSAVSTLAALALSIYLYTQTFSKVELATAFQQRDQVINNIGHALEVIMKKTGVKPEDIKLDAPAK